MLWGPWARAGLVSSNQKSRVLVSPMGVLSKGCIRHTGARRQGRLLITTDLVSQLEAKGAMNKGMTGVEVR